MDNQLRFAFGVSGVGQGIITKAYLSCPCLKGCLPSLFLEVGSKFEDEKGEKRKRIGFCSRFFREYTISGWEKWDFASVLYLALASCSVVHFASWLVRGWLQRNDDELFGHMHSCI